MADASFEFRPGRFGRSSAEPGLFVRELTDLALASVLSRRGAEAATVTAAQANLGITLPEAGRAAVGRDFAFLWSGPGHWLAIGAASDADVEARLAPALGDHASLFDQSDARVVLEVGGPRVREVLAKGVSIDLDARSFEAGCVALTSVSHLNVLLWQVDEAPRYRLCVVRTYFDSLWRWLASSAAEFGGEVLAPGAYSMPTAPSGR